MTIRRLEELSEIEKLSLIDMSYSRINTYDMCALKYFHGYVAKAPQVFGPAATLGNVIHEVLELHVGEDETLDLDALEETYKLSLEKRDPENLIDMDLVNAGLQMLADYVDNYGEDTLDILGKEHYFEMVVSSALVRGYIDRVDRIDDTTIEITDYKSGKHMAVQKHLPNNLQLGTYVLALALEYPEVQTFKGVLHYLRTDRKLTHTYTREDLPRLETNMVDAIQAIKDDIHHHPTKNTRMCSWCDFGVNGTCSTGAARNRFRR